MHDVATLHTHYTLKIIAAMSRVHGKLGRTKVATYS